MDNLLEQCQLKFDSKKTGEFEGYGSVFNSVDKIGDTIQKGAFIDAITKELPKMFINHNHSAIPVGDWLEAGEDSTGLFLAGKIDMNHTDGPSVHSAMLRKAMNGLSIGALKSTLVTEKTATGRLVTKADLKEVSIVTFPMEGNALIMDVKAEIERIKTLKDAEKILRESGYSKSEATAIVSQIRNIGQRDAEHVRDEIIKHNDATDELVAFIKNL
jgi:HK97 family phage prohead protease